MCVPVEFWFEIVRAMDVEDALSVEKDIVRLRQELDDLEKEEAELERHEEYALLEKYLHLSRALRESDAEDASSLTRTGVVNQLTTQVDQLESKIRLLEEEALQEEQRAQAESAKLRAAQEELEKLRLALTLEAVRHEEELRQTDELIFTTQRELESKDPSLTDLRQAIEEEAKQKWAPLLEVEQKKAAAELKAAKATEEDAVDSARDEAKVAIQEKYGEALALLNDRLEYQREVRQAWETRVNTLKTQVEALEQQDTMEASVAAHEDMRRGNQFLGLQATVEALWEVLEVDDEEALSFLMTSQEILSGSPEAAAILSEEERRLREKAGV